MYRNKLAPLTALVGFIALVAVFIYCTIEFSHAIEERSMRELEARAELASDRLAECLHTQDFASLRAFAEDCRSHGYGLLVKGKDGGMYFDGRDTKRDDMVSAKAACGEFAITLSLPKSRVTSPIDKAMPLFALALLVGASGMLFVFFAFYRQRAKIRELKHIELERRQFIADFSHELKTPLTGIIGSVEMLADADDNNRQRLLAMIDHESKRLNSLAQRILDLSRLEAGKTLGTRDELIELAISNLVENAHRHSGTDDITVREEEHNGKHYWIVEDHGIGIPPEAREKVFERFYRVDTSRAAESGGAGLGLAIVREIARQLGGDCICESVEPHGTRFIFSVNMI